MSFNKQSCVLSIFLAGILASGSASAADIGVPSRSVTSPESSERVFLFSGFDFNSFDGRFGFVGATLAAFDRLGTSGWRVGLFGAAGSYTYNLNGFKNAADFTTADVLVGDGFVTSNSNTKFLIGASVQDHNLSAPDPANPVQGSKVGLKVQGDAYIT